MARTTGVAHAAYELSNPPAGSQPARSDAVVVEPENIRLHGSKVAALEDAVDRGGRYAAWPHGMTLAEAIAQHERSKTPPKTVSPSSGATAGRPIADRPQA